MSNITNDIIIENSIILNGINITQPLYDIGSISFNTNDIMIYSGTNIISITPSSYKTLLNLDNVTNNLQVINAGNGVSFSSGTLVARPIASTNGRLYATTNDGIYLDNGTTWILQSPAYTGDITKPANSTTLTLPNINASIGTFNNITINAKGQATGGSNINYLLDSATNGIVVRTALNTTTGRTITGTANQITITNGDGVSGNPTLSIANNAVLPGNASLTIPIGTTAQRDTPTNGQIRFNTTLGYAEISDNNVYVPLGKIVQCVTGSIAQTTGTTTLPFDGTLPTITEGFEIWTQSITPFYNNSIIFVLYSINVSHDTILTTRNITTVLYNGTVAVAYNVGAGGQNTPVPLCVSDSFVSGTTSAITISARVGSNGGTISVNSTQTMGGITTSYIIMEII